MSALHNKSVALSSRYQMLTVSHVTYDTGSQYVGAYSKVMLLHLHGIDPLPMPTKATAAFQGTVCTK